MTPRERDRHRELLYREPADLTLDELIELLRIRHTADEPPPCPVCGGALSLSSTQGITRWSCSIWEDDPDESGKLRLKPGRRVTDDHYTLSRWVQERRGEPWVLELISRVEREFFRYDVLRTDDNGPTFTIKTGLPKDEAEKLYATLTDRGHKQVYFIKKSEG